MLFILKIMLHLRGRYNAEPDIYLGHICMLATFRPLFAVILLVTAQGVAAQERFFFSIGPIPLRSELYISERGKMPVFPPKTKYWIDSHEWDEESLTYKGVDRIYRNPSSWGLEGLAEEETSLFGSRLTSPGKFCSQNRSFNARQSRIAEHIIKEAKELPNGSLTWFYDYDQNLNDQILSAPINSAFSQAMNLHFLILAHCRTKKSNYLEVASRAGDALITPISQGGLMNDAHGETWFEEGPSAPGLMQYILNAHVYSVNVLFLLAEATGEKRFGDAAQRGVKTLERFLYKFDTGYWNRYDLRPRYHTLYLEVHHHPDSLVQHVEIRDRNNSGPQSRWSLCAKGCDLEIGVTRNGYSIRFAATIETLRSYFPTISDELQIEVIYTGNAEPQIYAAGIRPDMEEMIRIPSLKYSRGIVRSQLGIREFGWHSPGDNYIRFHAMLLADLYRWHGNPLFFTSAVRFANYHRAWRNEKGIPLPRLTERRFAPHTNEMDNSREDGIVSACFRDLDPTEVDLEVAAARLPNCGVAKHDKISILRRMGFRVNEENASVSDGQITKNLASLAKTP